MLHAAIHLVTLLTIATLSMPAAVMRAKCGEMTSRREIRAIRAIDRIRLLNEYKQLRRLIGAKQFATAMESDICEIVNRIDQALAPMRMPYWDARWDLRLARPADSILFSEDFFSFDTRRRRDKKKNTVKESVPRGLTAHFREMGVSTSLIPSIRANRAAQLLLILYQLGLWKDAAGGCHACRGSTLAFCDIQKYECVSRLAASANCTQFSATKDPCYASFCKEGVCRPPAKETIGVSGDVRITRKKAERAVTVRHRSLSMTSKATPTTTSSPTHAAEECFLLYDTDDLQPLYVSNNDTASLNFTAEWEVPTNLSSSTPAPENPLISSNSFVNHADAITKLLNGSRDYYKLPATNEDALSSVNPPPASHVASLLSATATKPSLVGMTKTTRSPTDQPHYDHMLNTWVYPFDASLPYPSVYFSITVVTGAYRPRPRPQRSVAGVSSFTQGGNLPSGYTHVVESLPTADGHVMRVPDPVASGVGVEFFLIVVHNGQECTKMCLYRRRYVQCKRPTVRLSKYHSLGDPVPLYKTPRQAIEHQWKGAGYYRRRTQDAFVFTCST